MFYWILSILLHFAFSKSCVQAQPYIFLFSPQELGNLYFKRGIKQEDWSWHEYTSKTGRQLFHSWPPEREQIWMLFLTEHGKDSEKCVCWRRTWLMQMRLHVPLGTALWYLGGGSGWPALLPPSLKEKYLLHRSSSPRSLVFWHRQRSWI